MRGVFGVGRRLERRPSERRMRQALRRMLAASMSPLYLLVELRNARHLEPKGVLAAVMAMVDRQMYAVIRERRAAANRDQRGDVLSLLLAARDEQGEPLTDHELRDELMSLVLAGHETTANSLAWTFERLLRTPAAYARLRELVRSGDRPAAQEYVEATIHEGMRNRPVIPMIARLAMRPWRLRRLPGARAHPGGRQHHRAAPPPRRVSRTRTRFAPGAIRRRQARHLHVDPVRRRDPPLPRGDAGDGRAARRAARRSRDGPTWWCPIRRPSAPRHAQRDDDPAGRLSGPGRAPLSGLTEV